MKPKTFLMLVIILFALAAATWFVVDFDTAAPRHSRMGQQPFAGLPVDRIAAITVTHAAGTVTLAQEGTVWVVTDRFGYPADFAKIADLVKKITDLGIGHAFEVFPDTLTRLHLHDPAAPDIAAIHKGLRLRFLDARRQPLLDLVLGKAREGSAGGGHYVLPDERGVGYLVDQDFSGLGRRAPDWIDRILLDVPPEAIERVECVDPRDGRVIYTLKRPAPDLEPVWTGAEAGDSVLDHRIDTVFRALINLGAEDVVGTADDADIPLSDDPRPHLVYRLYDGTVYTIHPGPSLSDAGDRFSLRVQVAFSPRLQDTREVDDALKALAQRASDLNDRLAPWVYAVPAWRHGGFVLDPTDFSAPTE